MVAELSNHDIVQWGIIAGAILTFFRLWGTVKSNATKEVEMRLQLDQLRKDFDDHRENERKHIGEKLDSMVSKLDNIAERLTIVETQIRERDNR